MRGPRHEQVTLIDAVPARCAKLLSDRRVEAALVPVIEYQRIPDLLVVPDVCVGSKSEVRSVVLASSREDLKAIRSVALDESSRTSATLVKIIFREFVGHEPRWTTYAPDLRRMLSENDAALIIGDPGMTFPRQGLRIWDMARLWNEFTNLGFIFAMWMLHSDAEGIARQVDFAAARNEGLRDLEAIVTTYENSLGLSRSAIKTYLTENISFHVTEEMGKGLQLYFELAQKHALISSAKELLFAASVQP